MTATTPPPLRTHHWLMRRKDKVFHAYASGRLGQATVCGQGQPIGDLGEMEIPGDRSLCCTNCFLQLFGLNPLSKP